MFSFKGASSLPYLDDSIFKQLSKQEFIPFRFIIFTFLSTTFLGAESHSPVGSIADLRTEGRWFNTWLGPIFFPRIDDSHCYRIHSSLTAVHYFDNGYVGKQPVA